VSIIKTFVSIIVTVHSWRLFGGAVSTVGHHHDRETIHQQYPRDPLAQSAGLVAE